MELQVRGQIGLACTLGFLLVAVVLRVALQRRWTGSSGVVLHRFGVTRAERVVGGFLAGAVVALVVALVAALTGRRMGGPAEVSGALVFGGVGVAVAAIAASFWAQLAMGASWRIGLDRAESTALVTNGPFRWVRNPIYTAMVAFVLGMGAVLPGPVTAVALVATLAGVESVVRFVEEPFLRTSHGAPYDDWTAQAGRFLPGVGRLSGARRRAGTAPSAR